MKKIILTILLFLLPIIAQASGKMMVSINETVLLTAETDVKMPQFKWNILQNKEIIDTTTGKTFTYNFQKAGEYTINLVVTSSQSDIVENSAIEVLVGASQQFSDSLKINLQAFPNLVDDKNIVLASDNLKAGFVLSGSDGDIREYRIDANINKDSNNDGILDNDIDNLNHISFQNGELWTYEYQANELPTKAIINLVDESLQNNTKTIDIGLSQTSLSSQKLKAVLEVYPQPSEDGRIHLSGDKAKITLFAGNSTGNIMEYRIDTNITQDGEDADGENANDIDNLNHPSFQNGDYFETDINRTDGDLAMQLIVVSAEGKGSKIQKHFVWDIDRSLEQSEEFRVFADKTEVFVGEPVNFGLDGFVTSDDYEIKWDFNNDKETDSTGSNTLASFVYDKAGEFEVLVQVKNEKLAVLKYGKLKILVKEKVVSDDKTDDPVASFVSEVNNNVVTFTNKSTVDKTLDDQTLKFDWKFGDGNSSTNENPVHTYAEAKKYTVRLTVTDVNNKTASDRQMVEIDNIAVDLLKINSETSEINSETPENNENNEVESVNSENPEDSNINPNEASETNNGNVEVTPEEENPENPENPEESETEDPNNEKSDSSILKMIMWGAIILFGGIFGLILFYLIFLKIKNPDYTFAEILEEEKEKILSTLEGQEYEPPHGEIVATGKKVHDGISEVLDKTTSATNNTIIDEKKTENNVKTAPVSSTENKSTVNSTTVKPVNTATFTPVENKEKIINNPIKNENASDIPEWLTNNQANKTPSNSNPVVKLAPTPNLASNSAKSSSSMPVAPSSPVPVQTVQVPVPTQTPMASNPINPPNLPPVPPNLPNTPPAPAWLNNNPPEEDDDDDIPDWLK